MTSPDDKTVIARQPPAPEGPPASSGVPDDERTVVVPATALPAAGSPHALPIGTRLAEFEIVRLIGEGGFGIVYLAYDTQLDRHVALKEYIPAALASRSGNDVTVKSERHADTFRAGLRSFINEARLLAQFDHPSLVKVYRFWEANGTAYMVMPYYEGVTLKEALRQMPGPPDEDWLRALLAPLVEALAVLHGAQCYHRDIAPDNIMLLKGSGRPLLLDFGAARRVIGDMTQALTVILKPGYAPVEQYAEVPSMKQGPWTDLYALAAVVYFAILGKTPPAAVGRLLNDTCAPLATEAAGRYSDPFLRALDRALSVQPHDRPQDVYALAAALGLAVDAADSTPDSTRSGNAAALGPAAVPVPGAGPATSTLQTSQRAAGASAVPASAAPRMPAGSRASGATPAAVPPEHGATAQGGKRPATIAAVAVGVVAIAVLGGWLALRPSLQPTTPGGKTVAQAPGVTPPAEANPAPPAAATPAPSTPTAPPASTSSPIVAAPASPTHGGSTPSAAPENVPPASAGTSLAAASPPAETVLPPYTPGGEFDRIVALADPAIHVTTALRSTVAHINRDHLQFRLGSDRAGYAYVFMVDPDGQYLMLFPNALDKNNAIAAGQQLNLPRASWPMLAGAPAGPNRFLAIVSPLPRDFGDGGLKRGSVFASFPPDARRNAAALRTARYSPFAGKPRCGAGSADCPDAFGAATFTIDVVN
ncbi:protein kinase domain-containing protein [Burkholderia sp. MR1-5-21]